MKDLILNFLLRVVFGSIAIYICNILLGNSFPTSFQIGLNPLNLLTIGSLGISGFGLVFVIAAFSIL